MADTKSIKEYQQQELSLKNKSSKSSIKQEGHAAKKAKIEH